MNDKYVYKTNAINKVAIFNLYLNILYSCNILYLNIYNLMESFIKFLTNFILHISFYYYLLVLYLFYFYLLLLITILA